MKNFWRYSAGHTLGGNSPQSLRKNNMQCPYSQKGLTLLELMVAMFLGMVVIIGAMSLMQKNRQNFRTAAAMSEIQENVRIAFELMARDLRQAGSSGCGRGVANNPAVTGTDWWSTWQPILGFNASTAPIANPGNFKSGTNSFQTQSITNTSGIIQTVTAGTAAPVVNVGEASPTYQSGNIVVVCDFNDVAKMYSVASVSGSSITISATGAESYQRNGHISQLTANTWYIGDNGRTEDGGFGLYRVRLVQNGAPSTVTEEILPGVTNMTMRYRDSTDAFVDADSVTNWESITAVEITLTLISTETNVAEGGTNTEKRLEDTFTTTIALRG